jgi:hypothetical protein
VLTVQPTTLASAVALLAHIGQPEFLWLESDETFLTTANENTDEELKRVGRDFPLRLAETLRGLIGGAQT